MLELKSNNARLLVDAENGGRLASFSVFSHELLITTARHPLGWGCYPLAPWAGRTQHGRFSFDGSQFVLPLTAGAHALHGTVWNRPWTIVDDNTLQTRLGDDWPFNGYAEQQFDLTDTSLNLRLTVHTEDTPFPAVIGWHPWFRKRLCSDDPAELRFKARVMYEVDEEMIPTGKLVEPSEGPWDDCFCDLVERPELVWPNALSLQLSSNLDHWVIYDKPAHAICVEPQSGPANALNSGAPLVTENQPIMGEFRWRWRRHQV